MWHVIQTISGKEEQVIEMIEKAVSVDAYEAVFFIKREYVQKEENGYKLYQKPMFPGYIFVITETPREFYYQLKKLPRFVRLLVDENTICKEVTVPEQRFLETLTNMTPDHTVKMSIAETDEEGKIIKATRRWAATLKRSSASGCANGMPVSKSHFLEEPSE